MILHAREHKVRGVVLNLDTNEPVRLVRWIDFDTGDFEAFRAGPDGQILRVNGKPVSYRSQARLKFIPSGNAYEPPPAPPEPLPVSTPTLPSKRGRRNARRLPVPLFDFLCDHPGCDRVAAWLTSDEEALPPQVEGSRRFSRARTVAVHAWCSFHYQPPRLLDAKGEVISIWDEAGGVRPQ
jgi:hypothetical protein